MGKKFIVSLLVVTLLNLAGCYSISDVSKEEFLKEEDKDIYLISSFGKYHFTAGNYIIKNDTLTGVGEKEIPGFGLAPYRGSVSLEWVRTFQIEHLNLLRTGGCILGLAGITLLILSLAISADITEAASK